MCKKDKWPIHAKAILWYISNNKNNSIKHIDFIIRNLNGIDWIKN